MKITSHRLGLICLGTLLLCSCLKEQPADIQPEQQLYNLNLNLSGFQSVIRPLSQNSGLQAQHVGLRAGIKNRTARAQITEADPVDHYLYFWTFNNENVLPEIALQEDVEFRVKGRSTENFTSGIRHQHFPEGVSLSIVGPESIEIRVPLEQVRKLDSISFQLQSSNTGPKAFRFLYSLDEGNDFLVLEENNQFSYAGPHATNWFLFDLEGRVDPLIHRSIIFRIEPLAGDRMGGGAHNTTTGTMRVDNVAVMGIPWLSTPQLPSISSLHYYVFDAETKAIVTEGSTPFQTTTNNQLSVQLPGGNYYAVVVSNVSSKELLLPPQLNSAYDFYVGNHFDNAFASIYGQKSERFAIDEADLNLDIELQRFFSQITFEFTDQEALDQVARLEVTRQHGHSFYFPFGTVGELPDPEANAVIWELPFEHGDKHITFNQFIGNPEEEFAVSYLLRALDAEGVLLRDVTVESKIRNNVQLSFTGKLLEPADFGAGFQVRLREDWDAEVTIPF